MFPNGGGALGQFLREIDADQNLLRLLKVYFHSTLASQRNISGGEYAHFAEPGVYIFLGRSTGRGDDLGVQGQPSGADSLVGMWQMAKYIEQNVLGEQKVRSERATMPRVMSLHLTLEVRSYQLAFCRKDWKVHLRTLQNGQMLPALTNPLPIPPSLPSIPHSDGFCKAHKNVGVFAL